MKRKKTHHSFAWIKYVLSKCATNIDSSLKKRIVSMRNSSSLSLLYNQSLFPFVFQHFPNASIYVVTDRIPVKVERGECLRETKKNERLDKRVRMLHCFVEEQWQDVLLLVNRSDCRWGSVWWVSMWNKKNERFDEKVGMIHRFVAEQSQDVVLLVNRYDCRWGSAW
jgi:hypothetical protein